jgi:LacI family transcriptional regulator
MKMPKEEISKKVNRKRVNLKDIAENSGFSINTVSRALRNKNDISDSTKEIIKEISKRLGYIPNKAAGSLRSGESKTVAIIIPDLTDPLFALWAKTIELALEEKGFDSLILNTYEDYEKEESAIFLALSYKVEGIILCPVQKSIKDINYLKMMNIPFVLLGRHFDEIDTDYVAMDDYKGGYIATQYLIDKKIRKILMLNAPKYISSSKERLEGHLDALKNNNIEVNEKMIREINILKKFACYKEMEKVKKENLIFDAIIAFSDLLAWQAIYFLNENNIDIEKNIKIIGFDNIQSIVHFPYALTSVNYSKEEVANEAAKILLKKINEKGFQKYIHKIIDTNLYIGNSA